MGGTTLWLLGRKLQGATLKIGDTAATAMKVAPGGFALRCKTPPGSGTLDLEVTTADGSAVMVSAFRYIGLPRPQIDSVNPNTATTAGGEAMRIHGHGFTGATNVLVQAVPATFTVESDYVIAFTMPAMPAGPQLLTVTTPRGNSQLSNAITVSPAVQGDTPTVGTISPNTGPAAGGTAITITGGDLAGATGVSIGAGQGVPCTDFVVVDDATITAVTPANPAGARQVIVQHPAGNVVRAGGFTYT
jgi:hypothetical protein